MDILSFLWIIFLFMTIQPLLRQKMLESQRQRLISKIEQMRNSRVILLVHRQETMSFLGFPVMKYIDVNDSEEVIRAIHMTDPDVPLDIILHTPGGLVLASYQIAHAIKRHRGKTTVFVPHYAMSGGTLIALAADEIVMGEHAVLGPVDPQIAGMPAASLVKLVRTKPLEEIDDTTWIYADIGQKAMNQLKKQVISLLEGNYPSEKAEEIATVLSEGRWTHDYPITYEEARALGLNVRMEVPSEIYQLMSLYKQPVKHQPSVEYLPIPKRQRPQIQKNN